MTQKNFRLRKIRFDEISLVDNGADPNALIQIHKRGVAAKGDNAMPDLDKLEVEMREAAATIVALNKRATDAEAALAKAQADLAASEKRIVDIQKSVAAGEGEDPILKSADPIVAAEIIKLRKANAASAAALAAMNEESEIKKFADKIRTEYAHLPVKADEFAPILKRASGTLSAEDFAELSRVLKAAEASMLNATKSVGYIGIAKSGSAEAEIDAEARQIAAKENVSFAKASALVMERNPSLYDRYLMERGNAN